jgi:hypothetical protein
MMMVTRKGARACGATPRRRAEFGSALLEVTFDG